MSVGCWPLPTPPTPPLQARAEEVTSVDPINEWVSNNTNVRASLPHKSVLFLLSHEQFIVSHERFLVSHERFAFVPHNHQLLITCPPPLLTSQGLIPDLLPASTQFNVALVDALTFQGNWSNVFNPG